MNTKIREAYDWAEEFYEKFYENGGPLNLFTDECLNTFVWNVIHTDKPFPELDDDNFKCDSIRKKIALLCLLEHGIYDSYDNPNDVVIITFRYDVRLKILKSEKYFRETEKKFKRGDRFSVNAVWYDVIEVTNDGIVEEPRYHKIIINPDLARPRRGGNKRK